MQTCSQKICPCHRVSVMSQQRPLKPPLDFPPAAALLRVPLYFRRGVEEVAGARLHCAQLQLGAGDLHQQQLQRLAMVVAGAGPV